MRAPGYTIRYMFAQRPEGNGAPNCTYAIALPQFEAPFNVPTGFTNGGVISGFCSIPSQHVRRGRNLLPELI